MRLLLLPILMLLLLAFSLESTGQSARASKKDTERLYRKIQGISERNKISYFIYQLFFRPLSSTTLSNPHLVSKRDKMVNRSYDTRCHGKIIRNIRISVFDPFGYDARDTSRTPISILEKTGNALHIKSLRQSIDHILLIKEYERFDSLRAKESERLIRSRSFVRETTFNPLLTAENSDSIDIYINVYDIWSIAIKGDVSESGFNIDLKDNNFLGLGHEFQNIYGENHTSGDKTFRSNYHIPNIYNTYISSLLSFDLDEENNYNATISLNRPFYSPLTKWAGGVSFLEHYHKGTLYNADSTSYIQDYKNQVQDYWTGWAFKIMKGLTAKARTTKLIISARIKQTNYLQKPRFHSDSLDPYSNETFYLLGTGISRRSYRADQYIFRYRITEDVPVGSAYSLIGGYQVMPNCKRYYMALRAYTGQYYPWGYLSAGIELGTFINNSSAEEGTFSVGSNYFTKLYHLRKWNIRQFVKVKYGAGLNRLPSDNISINNELGIHGFNSTGLTGKNQKLVLTLQTQSYAPWDVIGFKFGPYLITSLGMLGTKNQGFRSSRVYSQLGIGVLIRNEYLIRSSLQISIAYYPYIPGSGTSIFKVNPVRTTDFGFNDFDIGKPTVLPFQ